MLKEKMKKKTGTEMRGKSQGEWRKERKKKRPGGRG